VSVDTGILSGKEAYCGQFIVNSECRLIVNCTVFNTDIIITKKRKPGEVSSYVLVQRGHLLQEKFVII
jgi:hypothetical protein